MAGAETAGVSRIDCSCCAIGLALATASTELRVLFGGIDLTRCVRLATSPASRGGFLSFSCKSSCAAPPVQQHELRSLRATHLLRELEECSVQHRAVVVGDGDKPGFLYETAELDQMPRAFASCHYPGPRICARARRLKPVPRLAKLPCRPKRRHQCGARIAGLFPERIARRGDSMPT